ncbi:glycosyltransferase family 4 protein [Mariniflexile sp. AS56]|uniref:glycosyltransferase family 4 protein n=1 Tax=Mariniflexile sp. AS56 TaxID=3063957 RepID=UPI0026EEBD34|nr:glycosyltransferase family 4 protein [Mariniflexile sp. AS56]MDO7171356.1 glycosyltransferase family 4 protein [Mariniflexile sp. AS56]
MEEKKKIIRVVTSGMSFKLIPGQLKFLSNYYEVIGVSSQSPVLEEISTSEGIEIIPIELERHISLYKDLKSLYKLYRLFKNEKPHIVHSITPKAGLLSMMASYLARVPNRLHTFTGLIFPTQTGLFKKLLITTDRILCSCATRIFPEGNGVKNDLEKFKITSKPLKVLANGNVNGIDIDYFSMQHFSEDNQKETRANLKIDKKEFVFVFAGRLVKDKGINELISVFNKLCQTEQDVTLLLVGIYEEKLDPLLPETINSIKNNPKIIETGWVTDVRPYFAISDALAFPSYREGFPNVVMQAGAMQLPCIVTDINGCNEIIEHNETGIIIPVKDELALYNAMSYVLNNQSESNKMGAVSRQFITTKFERSIVWKALLSEYKSLN